MDYAQDKIRNIVLAGHSGAGKTTLAEALVYTTGGSDRQGRIEDGNTVCDFDPEEIKRRASLSLALAPIETGGVKFNLLDAPGLFDFELGLYEALPASESVLICVSARDGLQVGAQKAYNLAVKYKKARMIYISKIDAENADYYKVFEELKAEFGPSVCPVVVPVNQAGGLIYVNLVEMKAYKYINGAPREVPMPSIGHRLEGLTAAMSEAVAETDETLMEKFFDGVPFTTEELTEGVRMGVKTGAITPVLCGNAPKLEAMDMLLWAMRKMLPSAHRAGAIETVDSTGHTVEVACDKDEPLLAYVFKTVADPFVGKLSYVKVVSGMLKSDSAVVNGRTGESERMGKILYIKGKKQTDTDHIPAGDVGAITKLPEAKTGDTLCAPARILKGEAIVFPHPTLTMALKLRQKGDESKISSALQRMMEEDPTLSYQINAETVQQLLGGLGEQHLDVAVAKLKAKFGVEVELTKPRVAYRESIRKKVKAEGKHKKQTGGHGQYGHVWIEFEPCESENLVFETNVFGGSVPKNYFPAVEKGLQQAVHHGVLAGYPMVGLKATLLDGSYHPVDSSEMAFKTAAFLAYKAALPQASPVLLEPVGSLKAHVPEQNTGDLMGEINKRRGRVLGMHGAADGLQMIEAEVPESEMYNFTTYMRQLTQGRGHFTYEFVRYEPVPAVLEGKVVEEAKKIFGDGGEEE
ncbi:MAG: elongation factor G [Oscillospiraceae bacterium]|nr:elongation factor G [Oscillospiraceae bacterium]